MIHSRWLFLLAGVLSLTLFAPACGDDDGSGEPTRAADNTATAGDGGPYRYILTEAPDDAAAPEDQKVTVNLSGEPDSIDPQRSNFADNISIERQLFAGLMTFDDDLNLVPLVATEVPSTSNGGISADGLTYTFKLRDDVKWSDGQLLTADDFVFAMKRLFNPEAGVYYASFFTDIVGAAELYEATEATPAELEALEAAVAVRAVDDTTLEIRLARSVATFLQRMALHAAFPVREDVVTANPDTWTEPEHIVTNGPFKLKEWAHQDHITVESNPDFFLGEPVLQEITFTQQEDRNVALASYRAGELTTSSVPPAAVDNIRSTLANELHEGNTLVTFALMFNNSEPPFDDVNVRKAFTAAIDREAFVNGVHQGIGIPSITWMPAGIPGADAEVGIPFNAEQAKQYLAASEKYPNGEGIPTLTFIAADDSTNQLIAQFVKAQANDILGIDVEIQILESAAYEERYNNSEFQFAFSGWGADYPDPDNWLPHQFGTGESQNQHKYSNAEVDALFERAAVELDNSARIKLYQQAQKIILVDDAGIAPLNTDAVFELVKPNVRGWRLSPLDAQIPGDYNYARVYIAK